MSTGLAQTARALPHSSGMPMPTAWSLHRNRFIELRDFERPEHIVRPSPLRTPECCFGVEFAGSSNLFSSYWSLHVTPYAPPDLRFYKGGTVAATALSTRAEGQRIGTMRTRTSVPLGHYPDPFARVSLETESHENLVELAEAAVDMCEHNAKPPTPLTLISMSNLPP